MEYHLTCQSSTRKGFLSIILLLIALLSLIQVNLSAQSDDSRLRVKKESIYSEAMDQDREYLIYEPNDIENLENLPVIVVLDAYSQFNLTATALDYLSAVVQGNDILPNALVVGILSPNRNWDFTPIKAIDGKGPYRFENTGGGPLFLEFITKELLPYIDSSYNTCNYRTLIGHSLGGLFVFEALLDGSEYFDNFLAIDPAIGYAEGVYLIQILDALNKMDLSSKKLFFARANSVPTFFTKNQLASDTTNFMSLLEKPNLEFYLNDASKDWRIDIIKKYYEEHNHFSIPYPATDDALRFFFSDYTFPDIINYFHPECKDTNLVDKLKQHFQNVSEEMGCPMKPLEDYLNVWAWGCLLYTSPSPRDATLSRMPSSA